MKLSKKLSTLFAAFFLLAALMIGSAMTVSAASSIPTKVRIFPKTVNNYAVTFELPSTGDVIKNVKSSSKNLAVRQTSMSDEKSSYNTSNSVTLGMYAKKTGTYTVTFDIYSAAGKKKSSKKITVYAKSDSPVKKFTYNGKAYAYSANHAASGKIKVTMNSGYKLKKIEVGKYTVSKTIDGQESNLKWTKVNNGAKITLSKVPHTSSYEYGSLTDGYYCKRSTKQMDAETIVRITYTDKYTKQSATTFYYFYRFVG